MTPSLPVPRALIVLRAVLLAALLPTACRTVDHGAASPRDAADRIRRDIAYLADDRLEGRGTGTAGNDSAAAWLARRHFELRLLPVITEPEGCSDVGQSRCMGFLQRFTARGAELAHAGQPDGVRTQNVVAMAPGWDRALAGKEVVVIGAHFDHLGRSPANALDPQAKDAIRNGADDNASGTAAILELARRFAAHPARRAVVVVHFTGEELGLLGSQWFVEHSPVPVDGIVAMVNFDMVGRLRNDRLIVYGAATAREFPALIDSANVEPKLRINAVGDGFGPSDHSAFYAKGIPVLHFFTDLHDDYHRATDDIEKIDAAGEARVVAVAERVVRAIADRPGRLTAVRVAAPTMSPARQGSNVYLGTIPDMASSDVPGLKLTGVRVGSPADKGGLSSGDIIVGFAGREVKDLYTYSDALYAHKPGEEVEIVYLRGGERRTTKVTLGTRGQ
ncbi:MAG TPA: M28 family peptidase [Gemmatimonadaceae bacterium]|nr:M28 family peptidase [Gemmatimonadaceae bacterium]